VDFDAKLRLRRAEAAERAVWRRVGHRHAAADADVVASVRARRVQHAARQHDGAQRRVCAAVEQDVDVHGGESAVARDARAMPDHSGMSLRRRQHVFDAVVHELHRAARLERRERGVSGDHRRVFLFAAEAAAGFCLNHANAIAADAEQDRQRAVDVVRALHRAVHGDAAAVFCGHGDDAVRLDVQLFLRANAVFAFDDVIRLRESLLEIALVDRDRLERHRRSGRIVVWNGCLVVDVNVGGEQTIPAGVRKDDDGFCDVANRALGQARLVVVDQRDDVSAGNVVSVDDREAGRVEVV
jgi:hypothetical protein